MKKLLIILAIGLSIFVASCGNRGKITDGGYTIATLKGPSSMGMIKLIDSLSTLNNPAIKVEILDEPTQVRKMMLDGSADFAILPTTTAAILYNKEVDYKLIAIPVWGTLYLAGSDTTKTSWEALRNKTVFVMGKGMTPDVLFRYLLQKNGIDPDKDINLDYRFPSHIDLANAVAAGQAELAVLSEPQLSLVLKGNNTIRPLMDLNLQWIEAEGMAMAQTAFLGKGSTLSDRPELTQKIISSYRASTEWTNMYPDSAAALIVKYGILPDYSVALAAIPRSNLDFVEAGGISKRITDFLNVFYTMNPEITGGKLPDENFFY